MTTYDYEADTNQQKTDSKDGLAELSRLVNKLARQRVMVAKKEDELKEEKKNLENLAQVLIPDLMDELGQTSCQTSSGVTVTVTPKVRARLTDETREAAARWLEDHNQDKLLKNDFKIKLNKGEKENADALRSALDGLGIPYKNKLDVHPQTLGKFIRERDEAGEPVPDDLFNVYRYREAKTKI